MKRKIFSIVLVVSFSIVLWGFVSLSRDFFTSVSIPISIENIPEGYIVGYQSEDKVEVSIKGYGWQLASIVLGKTNEFMISADLTKGIQIKNTQNAIQNNSWLASNLVVVDISPPNIEFEVEPIDTKLVAVRPQLDIEFSPGYGLISQITAEPDSVNVIGPASFVNTIDYIDTKNLSLSKIENQYSGFVEFEQINKIKFSLPGCMVSFDVQKIVDKTFDGIQIIPTGVPPEQELSFIPAKVDVVLRGGIKILGRMSSNDISATIAFKDALNDTIGTLLPKIEIPENTTLVDIKPRRVTYIIRQF